MTLQQTLTQLTSLARDSDADALTTIRLLDGGAVLQFFWEASGDAALPREGHLHFGLKGDDPDQFLFATVIDVERYLWAVDEGLDDTKAESESQRLIEEYPEVINYLMGKPCVAMKIKGARIRA